ncbi:MAG: KTSC domain-containing protein [Mesorhizobium sp.]|nr:MAG: KTSC domain-containing protein [Mesorhizobium sp.]
MVDCVPPETFAAFKAAFAKGRYFNDHIRNHFRYRLAPTDGDLVVARVRNRQSSGKSLTLGTRRVGQLRLKDRESGNHGQVGRSAPQSRPGRPQ